MVLFRPSCFTNVKPGSQVLQPPPYSLTTPAKTWSQSILWRCNTWGKYRQRPSTSTACSKIIAHFTLHTSHHVQKYDLFQTLSEHHLRNATFAKLQCPKSRFPFRWRSNCSLQTPVPWTSHVFFGRGCHRWHRSYFGWKCGLCVAHALEDGWGNCVEICWLRWIADPNPCYSNLLVLISSLICTIWLWNLDMMAQVLWPLRCFSLVMNMSSHANAMPDLWRTSLVKDGISLAEHATLACNRQPRLQRPATDTQDHLWTWKCNKNGATEPSWVKIRSCTGPCETRVPAAPVQLLLLSFPVKAASWTATRKVEELQSSSRTALSVVHFLTEMISWPRQSSPSIQHGTGQKHNSKGCSYIWLFNHSTHRIVVKLPGLVVKVGVSQFLWQEVSRLQPRDQQNCLESASLLHIAWDSLPQAPWKAHLPQETSLQVTDSESTLCKQIEEWQVEHKKTAKTLPHVQWLLSLAASYCGEAWGHLPCLRCLPRPLFHSETQRPSWTAIFRGVDNWIRMKEAAYLPVLLQPTRMGNSWFATLQTFESSFPIVGESRGQTKASHNCNDPTMLGRKEPWSLPKLHIANEIIYKILQVSAPTHQLSERYQYLYWCRHDGRVTNISQIYDSPSETTYALFP